MSESYNGTSSRFRSFCVTNKLGGILFPEPFTDRNLTATDARTRYNIPEEQEMSNEVVARAAAVAECCCGRPSCAYLEHNNAALGGLEKHLETAARLGQALLHRHESYLASSESERVRLNSTISTLESEKSSLQSANEKIVAENRGLLDKLQTLNAQLADGDGLVRSLEATLASAQYEVRRLSGLANRAEELERQITLMEVERLGLQDSLAESREEGRTALVRWREAEGRVREMGKEVERIEAEANTDRGRHEEMLDRMERERGVRMPLLAPTGGSAEDSSSSPTTDKGGGDGTVVSHFVRDILQDNANLQAGIVELRELLQTSNEEVQNLREQILLHQPLGAINDSEQVEHALPLEDQLWNDQVRMHGLEPPKKVQQEVHVHHHYHAKLTPRKDRTPISRRPGQGRKSAKSSSSIGLLGSTSESLVPSTPIARLQRHVSSPLIPVLPPNQSLKRTQRWSMQSAMTGSTLSSMPSSPRSYFDHLSSASIFDRLDPEESSRPTSPESMGFPDQYVRAEKKTRRGKSIDHSLDAFEEMPEDDGEVPGGAGLTLKPAEDHIDAEERREVCVTDGIDEAPLRSSVACKAMPTTELFQLQPETEPPDRTGQEVLPPISDDPEVEEIRPSLRRSTSCDSLVSISGMDIHIARRKPSQVFVINRQLSPALLNAPSSRRTISASQPLASIAEVTASSVKRSLSSEGTSLSLAKLSGLASAPNKAVSTPSVEQQSGGLGRLVGGWVRGKWGIAPMKSTGDLRAQVTATNAFAGRTTGINQIGNIPGLRPPVRAPSEVHARVVNNGLLQETLAESLHLAAR